MKRLGVPDRRIRLLLFAQALWVGLVFLMGAWWGNLVLRQSARIAELEKASGVASSYVEYNQSKTKRMLQWESGAYLALLVASTGVLMWLYWRDGRRTRGIQAFFAAVTHELRTPLTSIRLQAESISENLSGDSRQKHLIQRLMEDTSRLESQVDKMLELARVEGGGRLLTRSLSLKPWLERSISQWRDTLGDQLELVSRVSDDLSVEADPTALQIICRNVLENAIKHGKRETEKICVRIDASGDGDGNVKIRFTDNGRGMSGDSKHLGKLFLRGPSSHGTGVGLYLIKLLTQKMGGKANFNASLSEGFEVLVKLKGSTENG